LILSTFDVAIWNELTKILSEIIFFKSFKSDEHVMRKKHSWYSPNLTLLLLFEIKKPRTYCTFFHVLDCIFFHRFDFDCTNINSHYLIKNHLLSNSEIFISFIIEKSFFFFSFPFLVDSTFSCYLVFRF